MATKFPGLPNLATLSDDWTQSRDSVRISLQRIEHALSQLYAGSNPVGSGEPGQTIFVAGGGGGGGSVTINQVNESELVGQTTDGLLMFGRGTDSLAHAIRVYAEGDTHGYGFPVLGTVRAATATAAGVAVLPSYTPNGIARVTPHAEPLSLAMGASGTYTTALSSATGATLTGQRFLEGLLQLTFGSATGTVTATIDLEMSHDTSAWCKYQSDSFPLSFNVGTIGTGLAQCWNLRIPAEYLRIRVSTTGMGANDAFVFSSAMLTMKA